MKNVVIVDSGCLVALLNKRDIYHQWIKTQLSKINPPLITCEAVISESCFLLERFEQSQKQDIMKLMQIGFIVTPFCLQTEIENIQQLMLKYQNVPMSFADACLVRLSEKYTNSSILTLDSDFNIYRKQTNQIIPVIMPSLDFKLN